MTYRTSERRYFAFDYPQFVDLDMAVQEMIEGRDVVRRDDLIWNVGVDPSHGPDATAYAFAGLTFDDQIVFRPVTEELVKLAKRTGNFVRRLTLDEFDFLFPPSKGSLISRKPKDLGHFNCAGRYIFPKT